MRSRTLAPSPSRKVTLTNRSRELRAAPTLSELKLWHALRGSRLAAAFRRQAVIGERIVDFVTHSARLVAEVDGAYHAHRVRADARRDAELARAGYRVLRVQASTVINDLPAVLALIRAHLD